MEGGSAPGTVLEDVGRDHGLGDGNGMAAEGYAYAEHGDDVDLKRRLKAEG